MELSWRRTSLPAARSRTDDVWFNDRDLGWAVNSNGIVYRTQDGGEIWEDLHLFPDSYLRCVAFTSRTEGWIGTLSGPHRLYATHDGGITWEPIETLPARGPGRVCGLAAPSTNVAFAAGTNYPNEPAGVVRTTDGGRTWTVLELGTTPVILVDILFSDPMNGWVVGGVDEVQHPDRKPVRRDVVPVVLATTDGGDTWTNVLQSTADLGVFPRGEWGWKIYRLGDSTLFVSLENFHDGAILRSDDLGATWKRLPINDRQRNANLEGIGFIDGQRGWVGGWGDHNLAGGFTSETSDGGRTWNDANHVGFRLNRFRFIGGPVEVGYASGDTVYKLSREPVPEVAFDERHLEASGVDAVVIDLDVPEGTRELDVIIWERFGREVRRLVRERSPVSGPRQLTWGFTDERGAAVGPGSFIVRAVTDQTATSQVVHRRPQRSNT